MNLNHLRAFHLVATYGSFNAAARAAGVSQPTLSAQLKLLEQQHGVRLLQRAGRSVEPTALGRKLLAISSRLYAAEMEAAALLGNGQNLAGGELRFGTDAPVHTVPLLTSIRANHPGLRIQLRSGNSTEIKHSILDGRVDVGTVADLEPHPLLSSRVLLAQDLVAVARHDHPLGHGKVTSLKQLVSQPLVIRERGSVTRRAIEDALHLAGLTPREVIETDSREAVQAAVLAGLGTGVMGEDEFSDDPRLVLLDFTDDIPPITEYLVFRRDREQDQLIRAVLDGL